MNNKFNFIATGKTINNELVERRLTDYLQFPVSDIINNTNDGIIFGGAIRDSIAEGQTIHDIDIAVLPHSCKTIYDILVDKGFEVEQRHTIDIVTMYIGIQQIHEPITLIKNGVVVKLIRPREGKLTKINPQKMKHNDYKQIMKDFVGQVDISCCGVAYSFDDGFFESLPGALNDCRYKTFTVLNNRVHGRIEKMESRGWKEVQNNIIGETQENDYGLTGMGGYTGYSG